MNYTKKSCDCADVDYYRSRTAELEEQQSRRDEREQRERDDRRREQRQLMDEQARSADDWPEAFSKQQSLLQERIRLSDLPCEADLIADWTKEIAAIERAQALYLERRPEVEALKKQIRESVAAQLEAEFPGNATSPAMRDDDIENYLNW